MSVIGEPLKFDRMQARPGKVTLVGAGPGDPELLTLKALRALQAASLVLYDALVGEEVLALIPPGADRIDVGKRAGHHSLSQTAICALMLRLAGSGRPLLRLKGGDPYIFGRGGEEVQALARAGIPFEVVPGISAAQGAAAMAGMPLTHRDHASAVVLATGHLRSERCGSDGEAAVDLDWDRLARPQQTVVIYMGIGALPVICRELVAHGLPADTPAATVERATRADQRTVSGTLATLPGLARAHAVQAPALIIVGGVVSLRAELATEATLVSGRPALRRVG
ncbi:uroporphyrinogen-III C-methyltransferase [Ideonella sp. DXS22W]|uniref:uroporphyrinogen-III C-methyltransferase n=1 Tax=Pseudaquabacterium inlustre TaxID=2984192 RepID=A0ABU9CH60_9BURK